MGLSFDELAERSPFDLSGGQQRRVAFAGVLAMEPEVLVLDEPVAGLDPLSREEFLGLIRELHAGGRTIVMVSHSMEDLAALSDRILVLSEGRLFRLGTPAEVFADAAALKAVKSAPGARLAPPARGRLYAGARPLRRAHPGRRYRRPTCGHPGGRRARCGGRLRGVAGCRRRRRGWWRRCLIAPSSASTGPRTRWFTPWIPG
ncbi:MAG: AAA family ATPase [Adlercreutzia sp.]